MGLRTWANRPPVTRRPAYFAGRLVTGGLFAHVRNPIYSAFIFLECPGLALLLWSWPGLALPLVAYAAYRRWISLEEARLQQRFGAEYAAYRPVSYTHLRAHETDSYLVCR